VQQTLAGKTVVVTRPEAQAGTLCDAVEARGGRALRFPVLAVASPFDESELALAARRLDEYDLAFFVSPNAVEFALGYILARRQWPPGLAVATVGRGSERALRGAGFEAVIAPRQGFDSEAVLSLPEFSTVALSGRHVVVFRGDGGRELLGDEMKRRGARVDHVTAYRRYCPESDIGSLLEAARAGSIDALVLTSSEGVRNLAQLAGAQGMSLLGSIPVYVPHARIAGFAFDAGFRSVVETDAGDAGIVRGLETGLGPTMSG
jgi:uroporphyrinogen-III synthase